MDTLTLHFVQFLACAILICIAGTKIETYAADISRASSMQQALAGAVLLAVATSLPEVITCTTAVIIGDPQLAIHNLLGGVIIQICILAFADMVVRPGALTYFAPNYVLLLQGVGLILMLVAALSLFIALGNLPDNLVGWQIGNLSFLLLPLLYVLVVRSMHEHRKKPVWKLASSNGQPQSEAPASEDKVSSELKPLLVRFIVASVVIMIAGWRLTISAESISELTGMSSSFVGLTALAFATSLPEISTVFASVKNKNFEMAVANIFGSNCFDVCLITFVAIASIPTCVACKFSASVAFAAAAGILVTGIYLWGLLERSNRTVLGVGIDSAMVLLCSFLSFWVVFKVS